jgi:hypothetical protein
MHYIIARLPLGVSRKEGSVVSAVKARGTEDDTAFRACPVRAGSMSCLQIMLLSFENGLRTIPEQQSRLALQPGRSNRRTAGPPLAAFGRDRVRAHKFSARCSSARIRPHTTGCSNPAGLPAGNYSGRIQVNAVALNAPQILTVTLNVLPAGSNPIPEVRPTRWIFTGATVATPGSHDVMLGNSQAQTPFYPSNSICKAPSPTCPRPPASSQGSPRPCGSFPI